MSMNDVNLENALSAVKDYAKKNLSNPDGLFIEDFSIEGISDKEDFFKGKSNEEILNIFKSLKSFGKLSIIRKNYQEFDMGHDVLFPLNFRLNKQ
ncbi:hypothetical protein [Oenococcus oeni]|uniref:hypothetical protein n=1 Tax=Oenococcus oeni TaxID=1247 RepID=UPI0010B8D75D|nr:hypothetical protein [Oenococcus oeni]SYW13315.1 hypothetical protein OENI_1160001 [Oenococcus oeni]